MTTRLSAPEVLERCMNQGIPDRVAARRALHATLATLASRLTEDENAALASTLPSELARIVAESEYDSDFDAPELYLRVARRSGASIGEAHEQADVVLRVLGETVHADVRRRLCRILPGPIARRLEGEALGAAPPHPTRSRAPAASTLANGKPGSRHPLSESAPSGGHAHAVSDNDDPHAETKLSSAHGVTQERLHETLAEGLPGPQRPLSGE